MDSERVAPVIGIVLLVLGILVLVFVFIQALAIVQAPGDYFDEHFPELSEEETKGPEARFRWHANDLTVDFTDDSRRGDAQIHSWYWDFGDQEFSNEQNPVHTYADSRNYNVRLTVRDGNGKEGTAEGNINVDYGAVDSGVVESESDESGTDLDFGKFILTLAAALLVGILFLVMFLVGAALVKAGWNLIKPGPSVVKLKIKPKKLEVEEAEASQPYYSPPSQGAQPPQPAYYPQQGLPTTPPAPPTQKSQGEDEKQEE